MLNFPQEETLTFTKVRVSKDIPFFTLNYNVVYKLT